MNHVLCKLPEIKDTTKSGIFIGETLIKQKQNEIQQYIEVVAVGTEVKDIMVGDKIYVDGNAKPKLVIIDEEKYLIFRDAVILGTFL